MCKAICCLSKTDRLSLKADKLVKNELEIVKWIQFKRTTEAALNKLLTKVQLKNIDKKFKFKFIDNLAEAELETPYSSSNDDNSSEKSKDRHTERVNDAQAFNSRTHLSDMLV